MTAPYRRTAAQRASDPARAKVFEAEVRRHLGPLVRDLTSATDELDWCIFGKIFLDAKERHQVLGARWLKHAPDVPAEELFVLDELSVRRACRHWPAAWFLLRDVTGDRLFLAWIVEVVCVERARLARDTKAKFLVDLRNFRQIESLDDVLPAMEDDVKSERWRQSGPVGRVEVPQA